MTTTLRLVTLTKLLIDSLAWDSAMVAVIPSIISLARSRAQGSSSHPRFITPILAALGSAFGMTVTAPNFIPDMFPAAPLAFH